MFLQMCQDEQLNPFTREIYLVKYGDDPAQFIIAVESHIKVAESRVNYDGHEAGVILKEPGKAPEFRLGEIVYPEEQVFLIGGWAKVYLKNRTRPVFASVNLREYQKYTRDGKLTRFWKDSPATQIRKVALVHALREAFPSRFTNTAAAIDGEYDDVTEDAIPEAFKTGEEENWKLFWAKQKEKGLNYESALAILGIKKMHEDWLDKGKTLEDADKALTDYLTNPKPSGNNPPAGEVKNDGAKAPAAAAIPAAGTTATSSIEKTDEERKAAAAAAEIDDLFEKLPAGDQRVKADPDDVSVMLLDMRKKGIPEVSKAALTDRFLNKYHVMRAELDKVKSIKGMLNLLPDPLLDGFIKWLNELYSKSVAGERKAPDIDKKPAAGENKPLQTESDRMFDALESASKKTVVTEDTAEWVESTIFSLRRNGCEEVTANKLADRWKNKYKVSQSIEGLTVKQTLVMLLPPDIKDFCKWLQDLEGKYPAKN